jgi:rhodanese-related sulfurtransferase
MTQQFLLENAWLIAAAALSGGMIVWQSLGKGGSNRVTPAQATALLNQKKAVMLDIRDDATVAQSGQIADAKRIAIADLKAKAETLVKNKALPIVVVCQTGQRSAAAAGILKGVGYPDVYVLEGGVAAWVEAGLPIRKSKAAA